MKRMICSNCNSKMKNIYYVVKKPTLKWVKVGYICEKCKNVQFINK
jgi:RNase P subunit RPR2